MSCDCKNSAPEVDCCEGGELIFTASNGARNEILSFRNSKKGFSFSAAVKTDGKGTGGSLDPLGSQGSLILSPDKKWILVVNAGSGDVSVLTAKPKPELTSRTRMTQGMPVSITMFKDLVYVVTSDTATPSDAILEGFKFHRGHLKPFRLIKLPTATYGQVSFTPCGKRLVITSKSTNQILVIPLNREGEPLDPVFSDSNGSTPFGVAFRGEFLLVAEAGSNAVSSYSINDDSTLTVISGSVENGQRATCWIIQCGGFIVTSNPGSSALSTYKVDKEGVVTLINGSIVRGLTTPIDIAFGHKFLYALDPGAGVIQAVWHSKIVETSPTVIPAFAQGLAVL